MSWKAAGSGSLSLMEREENGMKQLWNADLANGIYRNPILFTDYSDPDVIRVGEDYYMISSSFTYIPGVPVLHSKDLVNWELINYVVKKIPYDRYDRPAHGAGTWAPSLRYYEGIFYAFIPMPDEGIFVSKTTDPAGEWSPLKPVKEAKGWIDPCPFWDEDGKAYMVFAYARSRCGIKHRLSICEMTPSADALIGEPKLIYDGEQANPTIEGPKFYKRNGWYYIFAPAGGVKTGWQTVLRSRNVWGPYEARIVMHQGNAEVNGPHQGGYVETPDGSGWFAHFQDRDAYGRIVHLQPVCWNGDWPFIGTELNGDGIGEPVTAWKKPVETDWKAKPIPSEDDFTEETLGLQWQWQANPRQEWYSLTKKPGSLVLYCNNQPEREGSRLWYAGNACTQMLKAPEFQAEVKLSLNASETGDLISFGMLGHLYTYLALEKTADGYELILRRGTVLDADGAGEAEETTEVRQKTEPECGTPTVYVRICMSEDESYAYEISADGVHYQRFGGVYQAEKASWTGARLALYGGNSENLRSDGFGVCEYIHFQRSREEE